MEIPDIPFEAEAARVRQALRALARSVSPQTLKPLIDKGLAAILDTVSARTMSDEGTLWAIDREAQALVPIHHRGPDPAAFLARVSQPLGAGIISMVFAGGSSLCENDIAANPAHSQHIDQITGRETAAMIVTPIHAAGRVVAVLTGVKIRHARGAEPSCYTLEDLSALQATARLAGELIEHRMLVDLCGWDDA